MSYIANRPVRFDRDYKVGEVIPDTVIAPGMARKLVDMGRILCVDLPQGGAAAPEQPEDPQGDAGSTPDDRNSAGNINTQIGEETPPEGQETAPAPPVETDNPGESGGGMNAPATETFVCEECGREFGSRNALASHSQSHKS